MGITNTGILLLTQQAFGTAPVLDDSVFLGVGNSSLVETPTQTDLLGENPFRAPMDAGYPILQPDGTMVFRATFDVNQAAFSWEEWGIFTAQSGGTMLCRIVESNGVKMANQVWVFLVTVKLAAGSAPLTP